MQRQVYWTLVTLVASGGIASAEVDTSPAPTATESAVMLSGSGGSARGVSQDYMVLPPGGELTGSMRFITARGFEGFGDGETTRFTDLALFTMGGRYALLTRLELSASASFLAKQPSSTDEKPWQSAALGLRSPLGKTTALALGGSVGHLIDHPGQWTAQSLTLQWRKPIAKILTFDLSGGVEGIGINAPKERSAFITEVSGTASALFREPHGHWGAWGGIGYAVPVMTRGEDPTTGLALDPQPRLDFRIGTVVSLNQWDVFAEFAVIDRGDLANPATRLPVMNGGFDQRQILFGVSRHIDTTKRRHDPDEAYYVSQR